MLYVITACSLGSLALASNARGLCAVLFAETPKAALHNLQTMFPADKLTRAKTELDTALQKIINLIESPTPALFDEPMAIQGTAFQQRVWQALQTIPLGVTTTYAEIAAQIGAETSVRAVANACGANKLCIVIPCHRVVRSDGSLSGYRWGVERKRLLLSRERAAI